MPESKNKKKKNAVDAKLDKLKKESSNFEKDLAHAAELNKLAKEDSNLLTKYFLKQEAGRKEGRKKNLLKYNKRRIKELESKSDDKFDRAKRDIWESRIKRNAESDKKAKDSKTVLGWLWHKGQKTDEEPTDIEIVRRMKKNKSK